MAAKKPVLLGDAIEAALTKIGVTKERVAAWVGDCGCEARKKKLNGLHLWAKRVLGGSTAAAPPADHAKHLEDVLAQDFSEPPSRQL